MAEPAPDPECTENAKKCKTLKEKLCKDYYCEGGQKLRIFPNKPDDKDKQKDPERYYGAVCCLIANNKNDEENKTQLAYTDIKITAKIWPSMLSRNTLSCDKDKEECKIEELKGYFIEIGASPDPQDPENEESSLKKKCSQVIGDSNKDGVIKKKVPQERLTFPIRIKVDDLLKIKTKQDEEKPITIDNICQPITYELINMRVPIKRSYTTGLEKGRDGKGKIIDIDPIKNPRNELEAQCTKYFYPNWSPNGGAGDLRDGVLVQKQGNKVINYTIDCENPQSNNLCSMTECLDSGVKPNGWDGENPADDGSIVTYSQLSVTLKTPTGESGSCSQNIPVGLTLTTKTDDALPVTSINGVLDIGIPCEGFSDSENRPQFPNPQIDGGASGRIITVGGKPYIDRRTIVKLCRANNPPDLMTCEKVSDPNCDCSPFTEEDYIDYKTDIENMTKTGSQTSANYRTPGKFVNGPNTCEFYICNTCEQLQTSYKNIFGENVNIFDTFCKKEFNNSRKCWVCTNGKLSDMTYKEFCESKQKDDNITFIGWYDDNGDGKALTHKQAYAKCSPSVVCCIPNPVKTCWYSITKAADKEITINFKVKSTTELTLPFKKDGNTYNIKIDFPGGNDLNNPLARAKNALSAKITDHPLYSNLSKSSKLTVPGCSCDGNSNNFKNSILTNIKTSIKDALSQSYENYLSIAKDMISYTIMNNRNWLDVPSRQLKDLQGDVLFEGSNPFLGGSGINIIKNEILDIINNKYSREQKIKTFFNTYFNIDKETLEASIDSAVDGITLDCNATSTTLSSVNSLYDITISSKFINEFVKEDTKCLKPYTLKRQHYKYDTVNKEELTTIMRTEGDCSAYIDWLKTQNCCVKDSKWAEKVTMDSDTGMLTAAESPGTCKVIQPSFNADGTLLKSAADLCTSTKVKWENKIYSSKVLKICDDSDIPCECNESLTTECNAYNPDEDPNNPGKDPDDPDDPVDDSRKNPDPENKNEEKKTLPCSKMDVSVTNNGVMQNVSQNVHFPVKVTILNGDDQPVDIEVKTPEDLDTLVNSGSLGDTSHLDANLPKPVYRTRILAKIFNIDINKNTTINISKSTPCNETDNKKVVKDPDDPVDEKKEPDPPNCAKLRSSLQDGQILLNMINGKIRKINQEIFITQAADYEGSNTKLAKLKQKLQIEIDKRDQTQAKMKEIEDKLASCKENN